MEGVIKQYDPKAFIGIIVDAEGRSYLIKRNSFRKGTILEVGDAVHFSFSNLSAGPTAHGVVPKSVSKK